MSERVRSFLSLAWLSNPSEFSATHTRNKKNTERIRNFFVAGAEGIEPVEIGKRCVANIRKKINVYGTEKHIKDIVRTGHVGT